MGTDDWLWWKHGVLYQIYPRSFADGNGDGIGDLQGLVQKLDYLQELGVDGLWLSPIHPSPMKDFGYDISNYHDIDPVFGDIDLFKQFVEEAHQRNLRIIMDMVFNHTSDQHPWFQESRSSHKNPKRDWYIWHPGKKGKLPNNWRGAFGGPAWTWDEKTQEYYLHLFLPEQPDVNWRNPEVRDALFGVLNHWMELGVDGFRFDVINYIVKDEQFRNNPYRWHLGVPRRHDQQDHRFDRCQPESHTFLKEMRKVLDAYPQRMSVGEVFPNEGRIDQKASAAYLGDGSDELHMVFDFSANFAPFKASAFAKILKGQYASIPPHGWPVHVFSNHDQSRMPTRLAGGNEHKTKLLLTLLLSQRGTPFLYYGDELGMVDGKVPRNQMHDPVGLKYWPLYPGRDRSRTPMPWDSSPHAGFSSTQPWLPLHPAHRHQSVAIQEHQENSILSHTKLLIQLRRQRSSLNRGDWTLLTSSHDVLAYKRTYQGEQTLVFLNFSKQRKMCTALQELENSETWIILYSSLPERTSISLTQRQGFLDSYEALLLGRDP
ncbi:MAG: alpha-glucosidase [Spirochaetales bacterium]|nr:alpha-glucosidase [Spirochaetales bacterium]